VSTAELLFEPLVSDEKYDRTDWQEKDLRFLAPMPYSANWSQMGCYKTSTGLWLMERKRVKNALLVTSKGGKGAYFSDFYRCLPESWELYSVGVHDAIQYIEGYEKKVKLTDVLNKVASKSNKYPMVVMPHYDVLSDTNNKRSREKNKGLGTLDMLKELTWDMGLCDEAHRMKGRGKNQAQWTKNLKKIKFLHKHLMTGTGFVNNPAEIWSLLNWLAPTVWPSYWAFRNYFCDQFMDARGFRVIKGILPHRREEFVALRRRLGPRHMMHTVQKDIPHPVESVRHVDLNPTQRKMYDEIKTVLSTLDQQGQVLSSPNVLSQLNRLRQISVATPKVLSREFDAKQNRMVTSIKLVEPSKKLDEVMDILKELDDPTQKVVVFSAFKDPLHLLAERLDKSDIGYVHMEQHHSDGERYRLWHDVFPNDPTKKVFMSTLALGGESINLTCAQYMIFLDRSWSPKDMLQAVGRIYRPGQKHGCQIIYIDARKTVDSYVKGKLTTKEKWFNEIFTD